VQDEVETAKWTDFQKDLKKLTSKQLSLLTLSIRSAIIIWVRMSRYPSKFSWQLCAKRPDIQADFHAQGIRDAARAVLLNNRLAAIPVIQQKYSPPRVEFDFPSSALSRWLVFHGRPGPPLNKIAWPGECAVEEGGKVCPLRIDRKSLVPCLFVARV
jgi:hypothetical protein